MTLPIKQLTSIGQSLWYDNIQRRQLESGKLADLITRGEIRGMTSNPSIFNQAISKSDDYDSALIPLAWAGWDSERIFWELAIEDIQAAADLFTPLYNQTNGEDGYISLEVNPTFADDSERTLTQVEALWKRVDRPNLMIKIPATKECIPAIQKAIAAGININITLIFSLQRYQEVIEAYLCGLEERVEKGFPIDRIASVASFFISRVDTKIDAQLPNDSPLRGKAAIANAKMAYEFFQKYFVGNRFNKLQEKGARIQRPLWASTSTKNPAYPDTLYVDGLIGPHTVNTVPPQTLDAFRDHGKVESALTRNLDEARQVIEAIEALGISMEQVTKELEEEGVKAFVEAFTTLLDTIDERRKVAISQLGPLQGSVAKRINRLTADNIPTRLFNLDATLWTDDPDQMAMIKKRMGWLKLPETSRCLLPELRTLVNDVGSAGFTHVLLLGMGGSSLAPEVFSLAFGSSGIKFAILDSTDPYQLTSVVQEFPEGKTLYIISSKSGDTVEVQALFSYFWVREHADGSRFIAITDLGTFLERLAHERRFRKTIIADPTVGGRYSALTAFGLVPAALLGMDVERLLMRAEWMEKQCAVDIPTTRNPGLMLGAVFGQAALDGRDKLTIVADPPLVPFCSWLEQLIAESSGKQGKGILPVIGEDLGDPLLYDNDRLFFYLRQTGEYDEALSRLRNSGHPVIVMPVKEIYDLGAEFYRWEIATVIACVILGVNPFDQPDVQDSKDRTNKKILAYSHNNILEEANPVWENDNIKIFSPDPFAVVQMVNIIDSFLSQSQVGDYCGINAFLPRNAEIVGILEKLRMFIRKKYCKVVTVGFGPRYLHSTGQFHKGGPNTGLFLQITAEPVADMDIPNQQMTFGKLEFAQAIGDYEALKARSRRILHLHILNDITITLTAFLEEMLI